MTDEEHDVYVRYLNEVKQYIKYASIKELDDVLMIAFNHGVEAGKDMLMTKTLQDLYDDGALSQLL